MKKLFSKQASRFHIILSTILLLLFLSPLSATPLNYLYINAREGSASGGHTALRFDAETFHFQHYAGGMIRLVRHTSIDFDFQYRYLENRTIYQATIELTEAHYQQLHKHFNLIFLQQKQQDKLLKEINLNLSLLSREDEHPTLSIKGAGLFSQQAAAQGTEASTIEKIQRHIKQKYGDTFLSKKSRLLKEKISTLQARSWPESSLQLSDKDFLAVPYSFASQYIDVVSKLLFLQTIQKGTPLNKQYYFIPEQSNFKLSKSELEQLTVFQDTLINNLLFLLNSKRPDWGSAAFALYARILSLSLAIDSGILILLDSFTTDSFRIPSSEVNNYRALLSKQKNKALTKIIQLKSNLFTAHLPIAEKDYSRLEMLSNYYYERKRGLAENRSIRVSGEQLLPTKSIPIPNQLFPQFTAQQSAKAIQRLEHYQKSVTQQMQALYHYDLLTRNCVTEIFSTINKANISDKQIKELQELAQNNLFAFIPFGSFQSLSTNYQKRTLPSFRHQRLAKMYQQEDNARVYLREFNTLSARDYKFNDQDSAFLLFTDEDLWTRPLFGTLNLLTGITVSLYGGFTLPFDAGRTFKKGIMGILMSLPELAFFNIRKGSYKHLVPPISTD